ncbi:MAG: amino acid adenylation domain-containing protein [bacterium]|nr:amino acid adenylation domain-containing protein [bacterium]
MVELVQEYFTESARKYPDKLAVVFPGKDGSASGGKGRTLTYRELDEQSNRLAFALKGMGIKRGDRIAFCLHKSLKPIISILAILKVDSAYMPLNAKAPAARIRQMIDDARPTVVICDNSTADLVKGSEKILNVDEREDAINDLPASPLHFKNTVADLAYIIYTSGSTGAPKGVMITHRNIINATDWAVEEFGITEKDRMSQHPPLHFDLSTFDLYCAFKSGATLYLVPEELPLFPGQLMKFIEENKLTIWNSVPSVMVYLSNTGVVNGDRMPSVQKIFFNGEGFPARFLAEWMTTFPKKEFINMYGPTETTVQCSFHRIPAPPTDLAKLVPIGKACRNVEIFSVKEGGAVAEAGEEGELYVSGLGVGLGYWNNPEKTAESFIADPRPGKNGIVYQTGDLVHLREDGNYEFIGRKDFQVKVMGNRIELGDVEAALMALPYIEEAATTVVLARETDGSEIIGFVKLKINKIEATIKTDLVKLIPAYMIPAHIVVMQDALPRTSTGKVDRNKLKQ